MSKKDWSTLSNEELLAERKKFKTTPIVDAVLVGVMAGIVIYSLVVGSYSFLTLIPIWFAYKLIQKSQKDKELDEILKARGLKE